MANLLTRTAFRALMNALCSKLYQTVKARCSMRKYKKSLEHALDGGCLLFSILSVHIPGAAQP